MSKHFLLATPLDGLPEGWANEISACSERFSTSYLLDGKSSTSCPEPGFIPTHVDVVTGEKIEQYLPWLFRLYENSMRSLAAEFFGRDLYVSSDRANAININALRGLGSAYERHVDSNSVTGLLFCTTLCAGDGGALVFDSEAGAIAVYPQAGLFLAFDATATPHYVTPLRRNLTRLSIPMNYYFSENNQNRPNDLDNYLYGANEA